MIRQMILLFFMLFYFNRYNAEIMFYMNTERPVLEYTNEMFMTNMTFTSRRISRNDPRHYVTLSAVLIVPFDNNIRVNFYFYQFLSNRYQPSFVEMHFGFCDMIEKDVIFGAEVKKNLRMNETCPYPPGKYNLTDMAIPFVPKNFPFSRGRIYCNATLKTNRITHFLVSGYIDMEIKQNMIKRKKN